LEAKGECSPKGELRIMTVMIQTESLKARHNEEIIKLQNDHHVVLATRDSLHKEELDAADRRAAADKACLQGIVSLILCALIYHILTISYRLTTSTKK
jgi:hypothetical protein